MSFFPVVIKVAHLKELREFVSNKWGRPFDYVFYHNISDAAYEQFGIMCTFMWTFHRDEYSWYAHPSNRSWDGIDPPPVDGGSGNMSAFTPQMLLPKPRVAVHSRYRVHATHSRSGRISRIRAHYNYLMQMGVCMSPPFPRPEQVCNTTDNQPAVDGFHQEMHVFEYMGDHAYSDEEKKVEYQKRYERIKNCNHTWDVNELRVVMKPVNEMNNGWRH
jgi:hypothetical protein